MDNLINYFQDLSRFFSSKIDFDYIKIIVFLFFTYSFFGWVMECIRIYKKDKKFINRGFLIGPICPIYGLGVCLITVFLERYSNNYVVLYILATVLCGFVEYFTSLIMEKLFNARWWDYSNRKFNINGRVCLENLSLFGIGGCIVLCVFNPLLMKFYNLFSSQIQLIVFWVLESLFILDIIISLIIMIKFKNITYSQKDNTEEINEKVKEEIENKAEDIKENIEVKAEEFKKTLTLKQTNMKLSFTNKKKYFVNLKKEMDISHDRFMKKLSNAREDLEEQMMFRKDEFNYKKERFNDKMNSRKIELEKRIDEFKNGSILHKRIIEAFPNMKIKESKK